MLIKQFRTNLGQNQGQIQRSLNLLLAISIIKGQILKLISTMVLKYEGFTCPSNRKLINLKHVWEKSRKGFRIGSKSNK